MTTALLDRIIEVETAEREAQIAAQKAQESRTAQQIVDCLVAITDWIGDSGLQWRSTPSLNAIGNLENVQAVVELPDELNATAIAVHVAPTPTSRTNPAIYVAMAPPPTYWLDNELRWQQIRQPNVTLIDAIRASRAARPGWDTWKAAVVAEIERKRQRQIEELSQPHRWSVGYDETENIEANYRTLFELDRVAANDCWQLYQRNVAERDAYMAARQALLDHCIAIYPEYVAAREAFAATLAVVQTQYDETITLTEILIGVVENEDGSFVNQRSIMTLGQDEDGYWLECCPNYVRHAKYPYVLCAYRPIQIRVTETNIGTRAWWIAAPRFDGSLERDAYQLHTSLLVDLRAAQADINRLTDITATWPAAPQSWPGLTDDQVAQFVATFIRRQEEQ